MPRQANPMRETVVQHVKSTKALQQESISEQVRQVREKFQKELSSVSDVSLRLWVDQANGKARKSPAPSQKRQPKAQAKKQSKQTDSTSAKKNATTGARRGRKSKIEESAIDFLNGMYEGAIERLKKKYAEVELQRNILEMRQAELDMQVTTVANRLGVDEKKIMKDIKG